MIYRTCIGCVLEKQPCASREELRRKIKGMCITSLKWKCQTRKNRFNIGDPVWAHLYFGEVDDDGEQSSDDFPATVVGLLGTKALIFVRPGVSGRHDHEGFAPFIPKNNGFCKLPLSRLRDRDGKHEQVCRHCQQPESMGHPEGSDYICARQKS